MMEYHVKMRLNAEQVKDDTYIIHLSNGKTVEIVEQPEYNGTVWSWKIDSQYFGNDAHALDYLKRLIAEKLTGVRVIYHEKKNAPSICGEDGRGCRRPGECNSNLCMGCPIADAFFAERDGVKLVYAI